MSHKHESETEMSKNTDKNTEITRTPDLMPQANIKPGEVLWYRNLNLEAKLNILGIRWTYVENVPFSSIHYDSHNPTRLETKVDMVRATDMGYKVIEFGLAYPAIPIRADVRKALGGYHRSASCKEVGIKTCHAYLIHGIGPDMEEIIGAADNFGGKALTSEELMHLAVEYVISHPDDNIVHVAKLYEVKPTKLKDRAKVHKFRQTMSQNNTLVPNRDKLSHGTMMRLLVAKTKVTTPILYEMANLIANSKNITDIQARELIEAVLNAEPKTEENMRAAMASHTTQSAKSRNWGGKRKQRSLTVGERMLSDCRRLDGITAILETRDPRDIFLSGPERADFTAAAKVIISRLQKTVKTLKEAE